MALIPWSRHAPPMEVFGRPPRWRKMHSRHAMARLRRTRELVQLTAALVIAVTVGVLVWTEADLVRAQYRSLDEAGLAMAAASQIQALLGPASRPQPAEPPLAAPVYDMVAAGAASGVGASSQQATGAVTQAPAAGPVVASNLADASAANASPEGAGSEVASFAADTALNSAQPAAAAAVEPPAAATAVPAGIATTASARPVLVQPTVAPATTTYVVASGDSLFSLAVHFHTTVDEIVKLNKLTDPNTLAVGQKLLIPRPR